MFIILIHLLIVHMKKNSTTWGQKEKCTLILFSLDRRITKEWQKIMRIYWTTQWKMRRRPGWERCPLLAFPPGDLRNHVPPVNHGFCSVCSPAGAPAPKNVMEIRVLHRSSRRSAFASYLMTIVGWSYMLTDLRLWKSPPEADPGSAHDVRPAEHMFNKLVMKKT